jgi:outer membrane protein assembly factor BamB
MIESVSRWAVLGALFVSVAGGSARAGNWPQWRGPSGDSVSEETNLPLKWDEQTNVAWKCPLPGDGASTPAIWGKAIFVTSQQDDKLLLSRIDKTSGNIEWTRQVGTGTVKRMTLIPKSPAQRREQRFHKLHNMASPSPVTDGERVIVHFGNGDLAAYDFAGEKLWLRNLQKDHGTYTIWWGHANSPVLYQELVISVCMQDSLSDLGKDVTQSYVVAHDKKSGEVKWKVLRMTDASAEECDSYTTPIFIKDNNGVEMVVVGGDQIDAYEPATGKKLWFLPGMAKARTITGPTFAHGLVYATKGMRGDLLAVRPGERGRVSAPSAVVWKESTGTPDSSSPVVWKNLIFWITDNGIAHCHDARTGKRNWSERLQGDFKASPLAAEGRIYFLNLSGRCSVVAAREQFEKLADNQLAEETVASPAVSDERIYLRGRKALYCLGGPEPRKQNP